MLMIAALTLAAAPSQQQQPANQLERIRQRGSLQVLTCNGPTTFYAGPSGPAGLEYELAKLLADELGVALQMVTLPSRRAVLRAVSQGIGDVAAAGITVTAQRRQQLRFAPSYQTIAEQVVYRKGDADHPDKLSDLYGQEIAVSAGSSHAEHLAELATAHPELEWTAHADLSSAELLFLTYEHEIAYTIADSHKVALYRRYFPELRVGFDLSAPHKLAWALARQADASLLAAVTAFFKKIKANGTLRHLQERYYGHLEEINYVGTRRLLRHAEQRLPQYQAWFEQAAAKHDFDWRLLAAVSYQESHWRVDAVSPTGVRGLMMLTNDTATEVGVNNRLDPKQSIFGGARYLARIKRRIPEAVSEPDRTWLALVAYNMGHGHLLDAMKLTEQQDLNPHRWVNIKQNLPLLERRKWYSELKYGYARGYQALHYVQNIRAYYDILVWHTSGLEMLPISAEAANRVGQPTLD